MSFLLTLKKFHTVLVFPLLTLNKKINDRVAYLVDLLPQSNPVSLTYESPIMNHSTLGYQVNEGRSLIIYMEYLGNISDNGT